MISDRLLIFLENVCLMFVFLFYGCIQINFVIFLKVSRFHDLCVEYVGDGLTFVFSPDVTLYD